MKRSLKQSFFGVLLTLADWLAILICIYPIAAPIIDSSEKRPLEGSSQPISLWNVLFFIALIALSVLYLAHRHKRYVSLGCKKIWQIAKLVYHNIGRIIYYSLACLFYVSILVSGCSLLSRIGDSVKSFLTAPIGIKPYSQIGDFGGAVYFFLVVTIVLGMFYFAAKHFKKRRQPRTY